MENKTSKLTYRDDLKAEDLYMRDVVRYPLLSRKDEQEMAKQYVETQDPGLRQKLINANLRFVVKVANEYKSYGIPILDLIQEGNIGLIKALGKFEPDRGLRLISYAVWWIRAAIQEYVQKNYRLIKVVGGSKTRKIFGKLMTGKVKGLLDLIEEGHEIDAAELREAFGEVTSGELLAARRMVEREWSFDRPMSSSDGSDMGTLGDMISGGFEDEAALILEADRDGIRRALEAATIGLNDNELTVFTDRIQPDKEDRPTQEEVGNKIDLSHERVRQIENAVKKKMRQHLTAAGYGDYASV
ncbi:MAG: sigma-70 family RNA polymerase sigma factor [Candidatus Gracilibacteria bacterium]